MSNLRDVSILVMQQLTTDIRGIKMKLKNKMELNLKNLQSL